MQNRSWQRNADDFIARLEARVKRVCEGKDSPSPPQPPSPQATAAAQSQLNAQTARLMAQLNRVNTVTPYGKTTFTQDQPATFDQAGYNRAMSDYENALSIYNNNPASRTQQYDQNGNPLPMTLAPSMPDIESFRSPGSDTYTQTTELSPDQQKLLDQQTATLGNLGGQFQQNVSTPIDTGSVDALQAKAEQAITSRLDPIWDQRQKQFEQDMANKGIAFGSEAYDNASRDFNTGRNDAYQQAILAGMQQRPEILQEQTTLRDLPLAEMNALRTGGAPNVPGANPSPPIGVSPTDITGPTNLAYQGQLAGYNSQVATDNANTSGAYGIGTAVIMAIAL